ncbi:HypC/HybG/HupF family hydrogenase formation chaperone [Actinomadura monticuli]|uniref:HypC/HybG/HupF family hydrogenase formation chaperone n=1 Tax=Actinomadura monticuli TaxID=3097367 RepID=A0ABV4QI11_9ACTN
MERVGEVVAAEDGTALVHSGRTRFPASLVILELEDVPVAPGDWLVVHSGIAVRKITADEAAGRLSAHRDGPGARP